MEGDRCPICEKKDWHNAWLCRYCGYPDEKVWKDYIEKGYIKPGPRRPYVKKYYDSIFMNEDARNGR